MSDAAVTIADADNVLRRVPTFLPNYIKPDGTISSLSFAKRRGDNGLSVDLEKLSSYQKATLGNKRYRLLKINVGVIRHTINDGLDVVHDPVEGNNAHCLITGDINTKNKNYW